MCRCVHVVILIFVHCCYRCSGCGLFCSSFAVFFALTVMLLQHAMVTYHEQPLDMSVEVSVFVLASALHPSICLCLQANTNTAVVACIFACFPICLGTTVHSQVTMLTGDHCSSSSPQKDLTAATRLEPNSLDAWQTCACPGHCKPLHRVLPVQCCPFPHCCPSCGAWRFVHHLHFEK